MLFEDLRDFLQVRPGNGILEMRDDRVTTPFAIPGTMERAAVSVRAMEGGFYFVHDDGAMKRLLPAFDAVTKSPEFAGIQDEWIRCGLQIDEEGRIFTTTDETGMLEAVARVIEAQIVLGALCLAFAGHANGGMQQGANCACSATHD